MVENRCSVLDTSPIAEGSTAQRALRNTLELATLADELGYHRYWVPEHHSMRGVASAAPPVLTAAIAARTNRIRVGAGGVLLPQHAPLIVAEQFGTLEALHPGRIDLGLGRASGSPAYALEELRPVPDAFPEQIRQLLGFFRGDDARRTVAVPARGNEPAVWVLGSSPRSAAVASENGLPYAFAHHIAPHAAEESLAGYSGTTSLLSVSVIAAETDARAEWLAGSARLKTLCRAKGKSILLPPPEEAAAYAYTEDELAVLRIRATPIAGTLDTIAARLRELRDRTGAGELMITTPVYEHEDRLESYRILSRLGSVLG
ncbi:LLM class flavin-dependent oxidoreductase [Sciscionella marina]|uniref:LLM class flavin-dependent oxidoreductase n=1 Tax=Sciscionella marina TaxID=508770 RepID=UPI000362BC27|nr:LLM class flavin-dependent oxidoreductase [Sciscionella marina]